MSSNNQGQAPQASSPLMRLPRELRNQVYRELLVPEKLRNASDFKPSYLLEPTILRVNKQIHGEASEILYGENVWIMYTVNTALVNEEDNCRAFTSNLESFPGPIAFHVDLKYVGTEVVDMEPVDEIPNKVLVALCDFWRLFYGIFTSCYAFENYEISLHIQGSFFKHNVDEKELLDYFRDMRGLGKASVTGTTCPSTERELATHMMQLIRGIDDIFDRAKDFQLRGDEMRDSKQIQKAKDIYTQGYSYSRQMEWMPFPGRDSQKILRLKYKTLSLWFDRTICNIELETEYGRDWDYDGTLLCWAPIRWLCPGADTKLHEYGKLLCAGKGYDALKVILQAVRMCPVQYRVDEEIQAIEARLRAANPEEDSQS